jgi:hypothetical protein
MIMNLIYQTPMNFQIVWELNWVNCWNGENPNQQLNNMNNIINVILEVQRLTGEYIFNNNPDTSAQQLLSYS